MRSFHLEKKGLLILSLTHREIAICAAVAGVLASNLTPQGLTLGSFIKNWKSMSNQVTRKTNEVPLLISLCFRAQTLIS